MAEVLLWPLRGAVQRTPRRSLCAACISLCTSRRRLGVLHATPPRARSFHYRKVRPTAEDTVDPLSKPAVIDKAALHVVTVPIGNLKDFTIRALETLSGVDYIVTTDRPATKVLLDLVQIPSQGRLIHYSRTNRSATCAKLVELLKGGRSMALVTTSGTPCIGDVGAELVQEMQASGVRVTSVPGASALMSALAMCGVTASRVESGTSGNDANSHAHSSATDDVPARQAAGLVGRLDGLQDGSFYFGNVLPDAHGARLRVLRDTVAPAPYPCVFYELPRRLLTVLQDIAALLPTRRVYVLHEMTKLNESMHADTAARLAAYYLTQEAHLLLSKGQLTLVIAGAGPRETLAWLEQEARKRRRLRRPIAALLAGGKPKAKATPAASAPAERARRRLRRRRARLIRAIEQEQERLRVAMAINASDAARV